MPKLILLTDPTTTRQIALTAPETTVGRARSNDIVLDSERVSRFHAVLRMQDGWVTIQDLGSRNGVYVNAARIASHLLADRDEISVGDCRIRFLAGEGDLSAGEALRLMTLPGPLFDGETRD